MFRIVWDSFPGPEGLLCNETWTAVLRTTDNIIIGRHSFCVLLSKAGGMWGEGKVLCAAAGIPDKICYCVQEYLTKDINVGASQQLVADQPRTPEFGLGLLALCHVHGELSFL